MQASRGVSSGASPDRSSMGRSSMSFRFLSHLVIPFSTRSATVAISSRDGARPTWKLTTPEASRVKTPSGQTTWKCTKDPSAEWNRCTNVTLPVSAPARAEDVFCQRASSVTNKR